MPSDDASVSAAALAGVAALLQSLGAVHHGGGAWARVSATPSLRLTVDSASSPGLSARAFRGCIVLPYSLAALRARTLDLEQRMRWDHAIARLASAPLAGGAAAGPRFSVFYSATKPAAGGVISGRDFVDAVCVGAAAALPPAALGAAARPLADGAFVNAGTGLKAHDAFPATGALVRGFNHPSGWLFEPADAPPADDGGAPPPANSDGWTKVTYLIQPELAGWLMPAIVNGSLSGMFANFFGDMLAFLKTLQPQELKLGAAE